MTRYFLRFAYNGQNFHGWQIQPNAHSVQEELQKALSTLLRTEISIVGAGRTDTGVHAKEMFAHFEYEGVLDLLQLKYRLNRILHWDIAVFNLFPVSDDDHSRFSALARIYHYRVVLNKDPFQKDLAYKLPQIPDFHQMNEACKVLFEFKDFSCFSKSGTQTKTNNCTIMEARWVAHSDGWIFVVKADRFLRNMVRAIIGTLLQVGYGELEIDDFRRIIEAKNRSLAGESVPAHALYLQEVHYPESIEALFERNPS